MSWFQLNVTEAPRSLKHSMQGRPAQLAPAGGAVAPRHLVGKALSIRDLSFGYVLEPILKNIFRSSFET